MPDDWILRWDTLDEARPRLLNPAGLTGQSATAFPVDPGSQAENSYALFAGYLFDKETLLPGPGAPEADCIAAAYARWGEGLFDQLRGAFALAVWDEGKKRLLAGRDVIGLQPFYYWWNGRLILLSPNLDLILAQPEVSGAANRLVLAEYLLSFWHAHQRFETFYAEVKRLPAAHRLSLERGRLEFVRYWDPLPLGFQWASQEELETFPNLLERAIGRCLATGADSLALSGGFDSVSIALLAKEQLQDRPPLHAISLRFNLDEIDEGETQQAVARALGMPQVIRTLDESLDGMPYVEASLALSKTSPLPVLSQWQAMYAGLLRSAAGLGLNKLILGTGGDELFTVDPGYGADRLAALDLPGLWRYYRVMARTSPFSPIYVARVILWNAAFKPVALRRMGSTLERVAPALIAWKRRRKPMLQPWLAPNDPTLRQTIQHRLLNPIVEPIGPGDGVYLSRIRGMVQSSLLLAEQEQAESWARGAGFTLQYPYFDQDLVSLALRMHPEFLISGGRAKTPLRRLVEEKLQAVELPAKKVDFTKSAHEFLRQHGYAAWRSLNGPQRLAELELVDPDRLIPLMEEYFAGGNDSWLHPWLVLSAETWLQARF